MRTPRACDANDVVRLPEYRARFAQNPIVSSGFGPVC
jgi:hypothetical protein